MAPRWHAAVHKIYRTEGPRAVARALWLHALQHTPVATVLDWVLSDRYHEKVTAFPAVGYWPQIADPRSFNEKLLHRKLYTDDERFARVADKYRVREYVRERVGPEILTGCYHVTDDPGTIPFGELPAAFVLKGTHGSGMNRIVRDRQAADVEALVEQCREWLAEDYGANTGEYWYTEIRPRILVEEYIENDSGRAPADYKFYVFDGTVEYVHVDVGRFSDHTRRFYDADWNPREFERKYPLGPEVEAPPDLDRMRGIAERLGSPFEFVRVDLYNPREGEVVFGEMTLAPGAGHGRFDPVSVDFEFGSYW
jgi:hypothetical protein